METGQLNSATPKQFVLCFDGTGNKFAGDESDSNVLKIYRVSFFFFMHSSGLRVVVYSSITDGKWNRCWTAARVTSSTTTNLVSEHM